MCEFSKTMHLKTRSSQNITKENSEIMEQERLSLSIEIAVVWKNIRVKILPPVSTVCIHHFAGFN